MKAKPPHHVILDKVFAGIPTGSKLHISCPLEVAEELKSITPGSIISIQAFRGRLALNKNYDATWIDLQQELEKQNSWIHRHKLH